MVATNATKHSAKNATIMRLKVWFRVIFAPVLGLHHANRTMKKSTRIFRDSTHKMSNGD